MKNIRDLQKVGELIFKSLQNSLSSEEQELLSNWLKLDESNRALYDKLKGLDNFPDWMDSYNESNKSLDWDEIESRIKKPARQIIMRVLSYAAIILVIVSIGGYLLFFKNPEEQLHAQEKQVVTPGTSRAILSLDNGQSIILDSSTNMILSESDGGIIQKRKATIDYSDISDSDPSRKVSYNTITTPRGSEYHVVLSDGSRVYLNSMSSIRYPVSFRSEVRKIELTGEAYFEVKNVGDKPFIINVNSVDIEVLGTSFNVNAYENSDEIVTTLVDGSVKVKDSADPSNSTVLLPSQQSIFNVKTAQNKVKTVDVNLFIDWKNGKFNFYNESLENIMIVLARWYEIEVEYRESELKDLIFSGSMKRYDNLTKILDIIEATDKVEYSFKNDSTIVFMKGNSFP